MKLAYLRLPLCGVALIAALCACGASHDPQNNSNTNWLRECSASADCSGDELCACGVCTVACTNDDACQSDQAPDAVCASVAELACSGSSKGAVCTASCKRDKDCGDGALSCVEGSCIAARSETGEPERDAGVEPDADAPVIVEDGGAMETKDSGLVGPTEPPPPSPTCEERLGCAADSACLNDHCQRLWSGDGCERASEIRAACITDADCAQGLLCHIDGTCIEPGKCDRFGMATLATVGNVSGLVATEDSVFVVEYGTTSPPGHQNADGGIARVAIDDGSVKSLVTGLLRPADLLVDSQRVYWAERSGSTYTAFAADRADGANPTQLAVGTGTFSWLQNATHLYFVTEGDDGLYELFRLAKGTTTVEPLTNEDWEASPGDIGIDSQHVYLGGGRFVFDSMHDGVQWSLTDRTLSSRPWPVPTGVYDAENVYVEAGPEKQIVALSRSDAQPTVIATHIDEAYWYRPYRDQLYVAYLTNDEDLAVESAPLTPGDPIELLPRMPVAYDWFNFDISDRGLFWIQPPSKSSQSHLLRLASEAFSPKPAIAQGAEGGPCFGDMACDDGLTCVDSLCAVAVPTCEERLGCGPDEACLNEHCQRLWSGAGCEPAAGTRHVCDADEGCGPGLVCHIDHTCIEPGKCDAYGMTTYASVEDALDLTVTKDAVFLLEAGTEDALGNSRSDGAIIRVGFDGSVEPLVTGLDRPRMMKMDPERVYWRGGVSGQITLSSADRAGGANRVEIPFAGANMQWEQSATHIYVATDEHQPRYELYRFAKGTSDVEKLSDESWSGVAGAMVIDSENVYLSSEDDGRWSLSDHSFQAGIRVSEPSFVDRDRFYYVELNRSPYSWLIGELSKSDDKLITIADVPFAGDSSTPVLHPYRDHVYFGVSDGGDTTLYRAPIVPGEREKLLDVGDAFAIAISDRGVFWIQDHRLLSMVIEDYASGPSPAQGDTGAPCFGDGTCNDGLSCVDALCE